MITKYLIVVLTTLNVILWTEKPVDSEEPAKIVTIVDR